MNFIKIDDVILPTPRNCTISEHDLDSDSTGRSEDGYIFRERLRSNVCKLDLEWVRITPEKAKIIRDAIKNEFFEVTFWFLGEERTATMYAGDRNISPNFKPETNGAVEFWDVSFSLTER